MFSRRAASILAGAVTGGALWIAWAVHLHTVYCRERWAVARPGEPCVEPGDGFVLGIPFFAVVGAVIVWIAYEWFVARRSARPAV